MRKIAIILIIAVLSMTASFTALADGEVFDYYQDFTTDPTNPGDGIFAYGYGYSYYNANGIWASKTNSNDWVNSVVNVNGQESDKIYLQVKANPVWKTSFKLATLNVGETVASSYVLLDGPTATIRDTKGRILEKYTNDKPTCIVIVGALIDKTTNTADIFVGGSQIASGVEWKLDSLGKVSFCFSGNGETVDYRPSIDDVLVTCDETKFPTANDVLDVNIKEHSVESTKSADNGLISRVTGNLYISSSSTEYLYNQAWSDGLDFGSAINLDGRAKEKFYVKLSADLPINWRLKLNTKNKYDSDYTDGIWLDATKITDNITRMDGSVIGSFDFSYVDSPTIELLVNQLSKKATLWINDTRVTTNFDIDVTNIDKLAYLWSMKEGPGDRSDKRIKDLQITSDVSKLPVVSYRQSFENGVAPNDSYFIANTDTSYNENAAILKITETSESGKGFDIKTSNGVVDNVYASIDTMADNKVGLKIVAVKDTTETVIVNMDVEPSARKIQVYAIDGKVALVVDGKLVSANLPWVNGPDKIAYRFVNTTSTDIRVKVDNIVVTELEEEFASANLMSDIYSNGDNVVVDVLNTDATGGTADFITTTYNAANNSLDTIKVNNITIPQEKICTVGIPMPSASATIFVWESINSLMPLSAKYEVGK